MPAAATRPMSPEKFIAAFASAKTSAIVRTGSAESARQAMEAAIRGGFRIVEFTLTTPGALELIGEFTQRPDLIVGAGSVLSPQQADASAEAGARFLVSPVTDVEVIEQARKLGLAMMPGCSTPTEMLTAYRAGAQLQKLFPEPATGPRWVRQTLGPMPYLKIVPTSGVTLDNAAAFLAAGAHAVGFTNFLFDADDLAAGRYDAIEQRARQIVQRINAG